MKLSLKPHHLKRYKDIGMLFLKYGHSDLAKEFEIEESEQEKEAKIQQAGAANPNTEPEELANDLEAMGPTFIKLGQMLSSRPDLIPPIYCKALSRLQDKVKPFAYEEVERIVTEELGVRISKAFSFFDPKHMAAASLGQVHKAALRDGRQVVVKVQRPDIRQQIAEDFEVLEEIATFFDEHTEIGKRYQFVKILAEFKTTLLQELDYQCEASNLKRLSENLKEFPLIQIPLPVADYCTRHVLTMDFVSGTKITSLSPIVRLDIAGDALAEELFKAYLEQVLVDGFFHADPHPGNIFLTDDGRVALLDLGMVGTVTGQMQEILVKFLLAIGESNGDEVASIIKSASRKGDEFDEPEFRKRVCQMVSAQKGSTIAQQDVGMSVLSVATTGAETGLFVPSELTILGKTLLQLDQVGKVLSPKFDPNASIRRNVIRIMEKRMLKNASPGKLFAGMLEMKDFVGGLPRRVNKLLDAAANSELEVNVNTPDAHHLLNGFEKIANRITTGVILAALIIGASLLMQVNVTSFRIFGYPGLAMLCFLLGVGGSVWLVLGILIKDYKDKQDRD